MAKYIIYGVKIEKKRQIAKMKQYDGFGRFSPCIFEPSQSNKVGQNTNIISGVPEPAKNKNSVDKTIKHEVKSETLVLNQRLRSSIKKSPKQSPTKILGSLIA